MPEQVGICQNFQAGAYDLPTWDTGDVKVVYVKFHIVYREGVLSLGEVPCTPPPDQAGIDAMLVALNEEYAGAEIDFQQLGGLHEIESDDLHRIECISEATTLLSTYYNVNAIDVYFVDQLILQPDCPPPPSSISLCASVNGVGTATTSTLGDGVIVRNCGDEMWNPCDCSGFHGGQCASDPDPATWDCPEDCGLYVHKVLLHEMGHYFDLLHRNEIAYGVECTGINQSNCSTCGDFLCDTPAEPNPANYTITGCVASGLPQDACGGNPPYQPDITNYMNNRSETFPCRDHFTRLQLRRVRATLLNLRPELWM